MWYGKVVSSVEVSAVIYVNAVLGWQFLKYVKA